MNASISIRVARRKAVRCAPGALAARPPCGAQHADRSEDADGHERPLQRFRRLEPEVMPQLQVWERADGNERGPIEQDRIERARHSSALHANGTPCSRLAR